MKYEKISVKAYKHLGMYPVYSDDIYHGKEPFKIVGIRENEIELEGDFSGMNNIIQRSWKSDEKCFVVKTVCQEQLKPNGCQVHNIYCCGGGDVIGEHVNYWEL